MGYQESWVYIEPQWNFKNLIRAYEQAEAAGYYKLFGAEPLSVIILKRSFGKIPAGKSCYGCAETVVSTMFREYLDETLIFWANFKLSPLRPCWT